MARRRRYGSFTPARRAALKKAQLASARKRSRLGAVKQSISRNRGKIALGATLAVAGGAAGIYGGKRISTVRRKQRAMRELNGKYRVTLTPMTPMSGRYSGSPGMSKSGMGVLHFHHPSMTRGLRVSTVGGMSSGTAVLGGRSGSPSRRPVDRDAIPLYKPGNSKSWPSVGEKQARRNNRKLRKKGMIE